MAVALTFESVNKKFENGDFDDKNAIWVLPNYVIWIPSFVLTISCQNLK